MAVFLAPGFGLGERGWGESACNPGFTGSGLFFFFVGFFFAWGVFFRGGLKTRLRGRRTSPTCAAGAAADRPSRSRRDIGFDPPRSRAPTAAVAGEGAVLLGGWTFFRRPDATRPNGPVPSGTGHTLEARGGTRWMAPREGAPAPVSGWACPWLPRLCFGGLGGSRGFKACGGWAKGGRWEWNPPRPIQKHGIGGARSFSRLRTGFLPR